MPLFEYRCRQHHLLERFFHLASEAPGSMRCPSCQSRARRIFSTFHSSQERSIERLAKDSYYSPAMMNADVERFRYLRDNPIMAKTGRKTGATVRKKFKELKHGL